MPRETTSKKVKSIIIILFAIVFGATSGVIIALFHDLPQIQSLETYRPSAVTRILSADHVVLAELYHERRDPVALKEIPEYLISALLTAEDRNFRRHIGIDLKGIARALIRNLIRGKYSEGASTITQQLAKTLFLTSRKTLVRKIREAILAIQLERRYTKDEILQLYLNQIYFGSGAYGVASAARMFFGKSVSDLTLAQCALIAAMPRLPSKYSPLVNKELAIKRRNLVLKQMYQRGIIDQDQYFSALSEPVEVPENTNPVSKAPDFTEYVRSDLEEALGWDLVYKGGLIVETTLNYRLQKIAEKCMETHLKALAIRMEKRQAGGPGPQAAMVVLDVASGGILCMVGGRPGFSDTYNRVVKARRQPGSAFKPIVYACAIANGYTQAKTLPDMPVVYGQADGNTWEPKNYSKHFQGKMTLRQALAISQNIPAVRLMEALRPQSVVKLANQLGITSKLSPDLSLALGTSEMNLLELTSAYAAFANQGNHIRPFGIRQVKDHRGRVIFRTSPEITVALSRTDAAIVTDMLQAVIAEGTAKPASRLTCPVAGKTGTTNTNKDAWFIGFSPAIAAGVWIGRDDSQSLGPNETGGRTALPIWIDFMDQYLKDSPCAYFDLPNGTIYQWIHPKSGKPMNPGAPGAVKALFKAGTEPTD